MKEIQGKSTLVRVSAGRFELSVVNCTEYQTLDDPCIRSLSLCRMMCWCCSVPFVAFCTVLIAKKARVEIAVNPISLFSHVSI